MPDSSVLMASFVLLAVMLVVLWLHPPRSASNARPVSVQRKAPIVVFDTSFLMTWPDRFPAVIEESVEAILPAATLSELDGLKRDSGDRGIKARIAISRLQPALASGKAKPLALKKFPTSNLISPDTNDDQIVLTAAWVKRAHPAQRVVVASCDRLLLAKAQALGLEVL